MSYEGYSQNICEFGHRFDTPDLYHLEEEPLCPHCGHKIVLANAVDETNGDNVGYISDEDWNKFLHTPKKTEKCNLGHEHVLEEATYLIPSDEELKALRQMIVDWKRTTGKCSIPVYAYIHKR